MVSKAFKIKSVEVTSSKGAGEFLKEKGIQTLSQEEKDFLLEVLLTQRKDTRDFTPPARWKLNEEVDPHGDRFSSEERNHLAMGHLTDDEIANAAFLLGDDRINPLGGIVILTAAKERIRWLSRRVGELETALSKKS